MGLGDPQPVGERLAHLAAALHIEVGGIKGEHSLAGALRFSDFRECHLLLVGENDLFEERLIFACIVRVVGQHQAHPESLRGADQIAIEVPLLMCALTTGGILIVMPLQLKEIVVTKGRLIPADQVVGFSGALVAPDDRQMATEAGG